MSEESVDANSFCVFALCASPIISVNLVGSKIKKILLLYSNGVAQLETVSHLFMLIENFVAVSCVVSSGCCYY